MYRLRYFRNEIALILSYHAIFNSKTNLEDSITSIIHYFDCLLDDASYEAIIVYILLN